MPFAASLTLRLPRSLLPRSPSRRPLSGLCTAGARLASVAMALAFCLPPALVISISLAPTIVQAKSSGGASKAKAVKRQRAHRNVRPPAARAAQTARPPTLRPSANGTTLTSKKNADSAVESVLPTAFRNDLARAGIPLSSVSVFVARANAQAGEPPLLAWNSQRPMSPASTMKIVTTYAALSLLGPAFRWPTSAFVDGAIQDGILHGTLYLEGTGDPKIVPEELTDLIEQVRAAGITRIEGDLVLDKGYFDPSTRNAPALDDAPNAPYNVGPDPLLYAFKSLSFTVQPEAGGPVAVRVTPPLAQLRMVNHMVASRGPCHSTAAAAPALIPEPDGTLQARFSGTLALACGEQSTNIAVLNHTNFFVGGFLALWQQAGGSFAGNVREAPVPVAARRIAVHMSPPLSDVVHDINKFSNNVMARNLYLTIGAVAFKPPATIDGARRALRRWLRRLHIDTRGLEVDNGSGLSRNASISAATMAALLRSAQASPVAAPFIESLPTIGVDGTMRRRLTHHPVAGHGNIKTGTLSNVRSIAGYVDAANGERYIVVSFINDARSEAGGAAHDALLSWVYSATP